MESLRLNCQGYPTPEEAYQRAAQFQASGKWPQAEFLLLKILEALPDHADALHLLGVVAWQKGQAERAIDLIGQAIGKRPDVALFHANLCEMCRQSGRVGEAVGNGERAAALEPGNASAWSNLGVACYDAGDYDRAEACHRRALELAPGSLVSLNNLGSIQRARGDRAGAMEWFRKALAVDPGFVQALSNLGAMLVEVFRPDEAVPMLEQALRLAPGFAEARVNLAHARLLQERFEDAERLYRELQVRFPGDGTVCLGLARALSGLDRLEEALAVLAPLMGHAGLQEEALALAGELQADIGAFDRAAETFRSLEASVETPRTETLVALGRWRMATGRMEEARGLLEKAAAMAPDSFSPRYELILAEKVVAGDANLATLLHWAGSGTAVEGMDHVGLQYALGKAFDELGEYDRAFGHFREMARLQRARLAFDEAAEARLCEGLQVGVSRDFINARAGAGDASELPVFILGMPRSGTTLVEQILAAHPEVAAGGELRDLKAILRRPLSGGKPSPVPGEFDRIDTELLTQWGGGYAGSAARRALGARRVTDKMPANYFWLGLIPLMLPNARIIHVVRNPVDTCLSCYMQYFARKGQPATYDLAELGRHYVRYASLMEHWRRVWPGRFLELRYEDLVADPEGQTRRLLEHCGLGWDPACLAPHRGDAVVRTASIAQVRQPIHRHSVERWRRYEKHLGPLLAALGELAAAYPGS